ncbi:cyclophilin-like fold protein [Spirosoma pollinicola]|nr:cyclophilin-like fold protein [Spirosoma pollinicola]
MDNPIDSTEFTATLLKNATATAFKARLSIAHSMKDRGAGAVEW